MAAFTARMQKFGKKGEKTGWTYIEIPADIAAKLYPGMKKSFRVKGKLDSLAIKGVALIPMGEGAFIMALNSKIRKGIGKESGDVRVNIERDPEKPKFNKELMQCLRDEPEALLFFNSLAKSHQHYFSKWIDEAKTEETKAKRIARTLNALSRKMHYGEMIRAGI